MALQMPQCPVTVPWFWLIVTVSSKSSHLPISEQEEEIGQCHCELEPPPVWNHISQSSEDEESHTEGKLVSDANCPPVG